MKELKNKDIIIGLIILIVLCVIAIVLIIRREFPQEEKAQNIVHEKVEEEQSEREFDHVAGSVIENMQEDADLPDAINNDLNQAAASAKSDVEVAIYSEQAVSSEYHLEPILKEYTGEELWQLEEIYFYWSDYKLDAVDDLIHLPRVRTITNELSRTNNFYYYGDVDSKGNPNGSGLAVYADNAYYFGEWKDGKRSGQGMYWKVFPDKTGTLNDVPGVMEHIYNGKWANDYPNGEGQEHITYDCDVMEGEYIINNVIGNFSDGYYDGELYIMTIESENSTTDWEAVAERGVFQYYSDRPSATGKFKVWERMSEQEDKNDNYHWMYEEENTGFGIYGLKKQR